MTTFLPVRNGNQVHVLLPLTDNAEAKNSNAVLGLFDFNLEWVKDALLRNSKGEL